MLQHWARSFGACVAAVAGWAASASATEAVESEIPELAGGKLDARVRAKEDRSHLNLMFWTPVAKAAYGRSESSQTAPTHVYGGFFRPLARYPAAGDLLIGVNAVEAEKLDRSEAQVEHRLPIGLGIGAGYFESDPGPLLRFAKLSYRSQVGALSFVLSAQAQNVADRTSPGGYLAVMTEHGFLGGGHDGEQWRAAAAFISPDLGGGLRPAVEAFYVDSSVGNMPGSQFLMISGSLGFEKGFLSHPSRLGRAMGPQGLEYANPVSFISAAWNRRAEIWELGKHAGFRYVRRQTEGSPTSYSAEAVVFPLQVVERGGPLSYPFVGGYSRQDGDSDGVDTRGVVAGAALPIAFLKTSLAIDYAFETEALGGTLILIDSF